MFSPKNLLIHLFYVLIVVGLFLYGAQDSPLIGNMTMALIALDLAILVKENSHVASKLLLTPFWLFFYPNTFFMVTQLTNLQLASNTLWEQSSLILFMLTIPAILFGIMAGVESLELIFKGYNIRHYSLRLLVIGTLALTSSYAIYVAHFANLHSWDIFVQPFIVLNSMLAAISWETFPFIIGFTFIQIMVLVFAVDE
ncbi:TPA: DUF1361 domain-containing protein [Streptococcus suis]|nr:DUF1361 domain-containing protein [Streptococcus suis]HEM5989121.1 DUF1361 domain-containing protein [Streptococcus suis]